LLAQIASSAKGTATAQYRLKHYDGSWRYTETAATSALHIRGLQGIICNSRDITDAKNFEQELLLSRDQLRRLAAHAENTREQERIRIAREIHDELGQTLSALRLDLEQLAMKYGPDNTAARKEFTRRVEDMIRNIDLTILTVRRISAELRPGVLDHLGLAAALDWQIDQFQSRTSIRCRCRGLARSFPLDVEASTAVFRIFQEILTNIVRHANASAVAIDVAVKADWFTLCVAECNGPQNLDRKKALS
jgi:signal transduction histidine kinase